MGRDLENLELIGVMGLRVGGLKWVCLRGVVSWEGLGVLEVWGGLLLKKLRLVLVFGR